MVSPARLWRRARPRQRLAVVAAAHLALAAAYIAAFSQTFGFGYRLIVLHLSVLVVLLATATLALALVLILTRAPVARRLVSLLAASAFAGLTLLYGADLFSNWHWGHNVTFELAARYLVRPVVLGGYISAMGYGLAVVAIGAIALAGAVFLVWSDVVVDGVDDLVRPADGPRGMGRLAAVLAGSASAALVAGLAVALPLSPAARTALLEREPLLGFVVDHGSAHQLALTQFAAKFREEGPAVRAAYGTHHVFERRNVVIVVADSLRPDHMQIYGYPRPTTPFLERLRQDGRLQQVQLALASCPESNCGISSILASKTFGSLVPENFTIDKLLQDQGYTANFVLSGDHTWLGLREFYGHDMTLFFDGHSSSQYQPTDDRVIFEGLEQVPSFSGVPAFFYVHLMSTHEVGYRLEPYVIYEPSRPNSFWGGDAAMRLNSYDNGVIQADAMIEQLFEALDRKGYLDDALVLILSDHGEGLSVQHGDWAPGHGVSLSQEFLRIPLLIYDRPGAEYGNLEFATHVDVAPTIVTRLGLPVPASWEGHSLLAPEIKAYSVHYIDRWLSFQARFPSYAVVHVTSDAVYKYLRQHDGEELYELRSDPDEQQNLIRSRAGIASRLRRQLERAFAPSSE